MELIGRESERLIIERLIESERSEFLAIYGRRRIGKTFLIDQVCGTKIVFSMTGLHHANLSEQLQNFTLAFQNKTRKFISKPTNWLEAFNLLIQYIENLPKGKKVVFIDELPWLSTPRTNFLGSIEHFWNSWASKRTDILLVVCGSAASWMINNIVKNKGGLHNRLTQTIRLLPFKLKDTELLLKKNGIQFTKYQIAQLYMIMGGVPYYLMAVEKGMSIDQIINDLCFSKDGLLRNEFDYVYHSLFDNPDTHLTIIRALASKNRGLTRSEILEETKLPNAGSTTRLLEELEESGFIIKYTPILNKNKDSLYRIVDFYTLFYLKFIQNQKVNSNTYLSISRLPNWVIWQGLAFENICFQHIKAIKNKLGISGVNTQQASWVKKGTSNEKGTQIDLLIDRDDAIISVCEMKFSTDYFTIKKDYAESLRNKISIFREASKTKKSIFLTLITTFGIQKNDYASELVQNDIILEDLFV
jgi:uncharacterized protein